MKRKREEHNGCGGGTPGSQKTRRTAPPPAVPPRVRPCPLCRESRSRSAELGFFSGFLSVFLRFSVQPQRWYPALFRTCLGSLGVSGGETDGPASFPGSLFPPVPKCLAALIFSAPSAWRTCAAASCVPRRRTRR